MNEYRAQTVLMSSPASLSLRAAGPADRDALAPLAALDSAAALHGPVLVADAGGGPVAAVSLADGRAVADPFTHSAEALALLRLRARQQASVAPVGRRRLSRFTRLALG
jgi:hypothetical protein